MTSILEKQIRSHSKWSLPKKGPCPCYHQRLVELPSYVSTNLIFYLSLLDLKVKLRCLETFDTCQTTSTELLLLLLVKEYHKRMKRTRTNTIRPVRWKCTSCDCSIYDTNRRYKCYACDKNFCYRCMLDFGQNIRTNEGYFVRACSGDCADSLTDEWYHHLEIKRDSLHKDFTQRLPWMHVFILWWCS